MPDLKVMPFSCTSHFKTGIPYSQALRLRLICDDQETLEKRIPQYTDYFVACGYKRSFANKKIEKVPKNDRKNALTLKGLGGGVFSTRLEVFLPITLEVIKLHSGNLVTFLKFNAK